MGSLFDLTGKKAVVTGASGGIGFSCTLLAMMSRMIIYRHYHNYVIARRVEEWLRKNNEIHGERAGLNQEQITEVREKYWDRRHF